MKKLLALLCCFCTLLACTTLFSCEADSRSSQEKSSYTENLTAENTSPHTNSQNSGYAARWEAETARHKQKLAELEDTYKEELRECESDISVQKAGCTMKEEECKAKISELDAQIAEKYAELNKIPSSSNSIDPGNNSINIAKRSSLLTTIQSLQSKRYQYTSILNRYKTIRSLENKKLQIENEYTNAVLAECELYEKNLKEIK